MRNKNAKVPDISKMFTDPGQDEKIIYEGKLMKDGTVQLVEVGRESMQARIDSEKDTTDMAYIIRQLELGNMDVLRPDDGVFGDFSQMPKTYAEVLQLRIDAETAFYKLPLDTRQKFNNNFNEWFMNAGDVDWIKKMDLLKEVEKVEDKGEEVNES